MVNDAVGTTIASTEIGMDDRHERQRAASVWRCGGGPDQRPVHRRHDANQCGHFHLGAAVAPGLAGLAAAATARGSRLVRGHLRTAASESMFERCSACALDT